MTGYGSWRFIFREGVGVSGDVNQFKFEKKNCTGIHFFNPKFLFVIILHLPLIKQNAFLYAIEAIRNNIEIFSSDFVRAAVYWMLVLYL